MNNKSTIILIALLAALGLAYYFISGVATNSPVNPVKGQGELLLTMQGQPLRDKNITKIQVISKDSPSPLVLEKQANKWSETSPVTFPLDDEYIKQLLEAMTALRTTESFAPNTPDAPSLQVTGLADSQHQINITLENNQQYRITLGKEILGGRAYVTINDDPTILVTTNLFQQILTTAEPQNLWTSKLPLPALSQLNKFSIQSHNTTTDFYNSYGNWYLNQQATIRANSPHITTLFAKLDPIEIQTPANELKVSRETIFTPTNIIATLRFEYAKQPYELTIGPAADIKKTRYYASLQSPITTDTAIFTVSADLVEAIDIPLVDWRDTKLFDIPSDRFQSLEITASSNPTIVITYDPINAQYRFTTPLPDYSIDQQFTNIYIHSLLQAQGTAFILNPQHDDKPLMSITIKQFRRTQPQIVDVYPFTPSDHQVRWIDNTDQNLASLKYLAIRRGETVGYLLTTQQYDMLKLTTLDLRDRTIIDLTTDMPTQIKLTNQAGTYDFIKINNDWSLKDAGSKFERRDFNTLLAALSPLRTTTWLTSTKTSPTFSPNITIALSYADQQQPSILKIDTQSHQAEFQTTPPLQGRFSISPQFAEIIDKEFRNRTVLTLFPAQIESLKINTKTISRNPSGQYLLNGYPIKDQSIAANLINLLAALQAKYYLQELPASKASSSPIYTITINLTGNRIYHLELYPSANTKDTPQYAKLIPPLPAKPIYFELPNQIASKITADYQNLK